MIDEHARNILVKVLMEAFNVKKVIPTRKHLMQKIRSVAYGSGQLQQQSLGHRLAQPDKGHALYIDLNSMCS